MWLTARKKRLAPMGLLKLHIRSLLLKCSIWKSSLVFLLIQKYLNSVWIFITCAISSAVHIADLNLKSQYFLIRDTNPFQELLLYSLWRHWISTYRYTVKYRYQKRYLDIFYFFWYLRCLAEKIQYRKLFRKWPRRWRRLISSIHWLIHADEEHA